jgi:hypothetical protein
MASEDKALAVKAAIDLTVRTIEQRARLYRNLAAAVSVFLVGSVVTTAVLRSWWPLTGLLLIVPATGGYLGWDARLVRRWMTTILSLEETNTTTLAWFSKALLSHPLVPKATVQGMLAQLNSETAISKDTK